MAGVWRTRLASLGSEVRSGLLHGRFGGAKKDRLGWVACVQRRTKDQARRLSLCSHVAGRAGCTREGIRTLQKRCRGCRQIGDNVWEKQRTRGSYEEGLKKAAKGDALAGMVRCHPGKEGPPESSWEGAGHSLLLHPLQTLRPPASSMGRWAGQRQPARPSASVSLACCCSPCAAINCPCLSATNPDARLCWAHDS